jgi:hypothetical protein
LLGAIWFIVFLWFGLGIYAMPILWLPYLGEIWIRTMDVYRIWLYLGVPMCMLAARGFLRSGIKLQARRNSLILLLLALTITPIAISIILKANYAFTAPVNQILPYSASNAEIPQEILDYFQNDQSQGRILGIAVPLWIYVLPNYAHKPLIDGWYPQSKLVTQLVKINDYRLDDLETTDDQKRLEIWSSLIASSKQLDITWVIVGSEAIANQMMNALTQAGFAQQLTVQYPIATPGERGQLLVFKALSIPSYVDGPEGFVEQVARPTPDKIILTVNQTSTSTIIVVREAYFPTWVAEADGASVSVMREQYSGFMLLNVPPNTRELTIFQKPQSTLWNSISGVSLAIWMALWARLLIKKRRIG